jgi:hypothetical protein
LPNLVGFAGKGFRGKPPEPVRNLPASVINPCQHPKPIRSQFSNLVGSGGYISPSACKHHATLLRSNAGLMIVHTTTANHHAIQNGVC